MVSITPDERHALKIAFLTAALTTAATAGVNWLFHEAHRAVQARRERNAARAAAANASTAPTAGEGEVRS